MTYRKKFKEGKEVEKLKNQFDMKLNSIQLDDRKLLNYSIEHILDEYPLIRKYVLHESGLKRGLPMIPLDKEFVLKALNYFEEQGKFKEIGRLFDTIINKNDDEAIIVKAIQWYEKIGEYFKVRKIIESKIKGKSVTQVWKIIFEGLLFEIRVGSYQFVTNGFQLLTNKRVVGTAFAPIHYEYALFHFKLMDYEKSKELCLKALQLYPKYIHLLLLLLKIHCRQYDIKVKNITSEEYKIEQMNIIYKKLLQERLDNFQELDLQNIEKMQLEEFKEMQTNGLVKLKNELFKELQEVIDVHANKLSGDVQWKAWLESSLILCEFDWGKEASERLIQSTSCSPTNTTWKSFVLFSRQIMPKDSKLACDYLLQAEKIITDKQKGVIMIEHAHIDEINENITRAMNAAREIFSNTDDWKYSIETVMILLRCGKTKDAYELCKEIIQLFPSTGRVWGLFVMLSKTEGIHEQQKAFVMALKNAPKSGRRNYYLAKLYLHYAQIFTPQYGDLYIECLRLIVLSKDYSLLKQVTVSCLHSDPNYGLLWTFYKQKRSSSLQVLKNAYKNLKLSYHNGISSLPLDIYQNCLLFPFEIRLKMIIGSELFKA
ncbi:Uncharacterized protein QTN25_004669 [Entamoeba marina]